MFINFCVKAKQFLRNLDIIHKIQHTSMFKRPQETRNRRKPPQSCTEHLQKSNFDRLLTGENEMLSP
jgi:hypothetical protein